MKKNVAIPVDTLRLAAARAAEIERLERVDTLSAATKQSELETIANQISAISTKYDNDVRALQEEHNRAEAESGFSDARFVETNGKLAKLAADADIAINALRARAGRMKLILTVEERATQLSTLRQEQQREQSSYGLKEMTIEEIAQRNEDEIRFEEKKAKESWRFNRLMAYPIIEDQLDALWKGGQEMSDMRDKIMAVKAQFPKPPEQ